MNALFGQLHEESLPMHTSSGTSCTTEAKVLVASRRTPSSPSVMRPSTGTTKKMT
jgi:hypothetical protein